MWLPALESEPLVKVGPHTMLLHKFEISTSQQIASNVGQIFGVIFINLPT